MNQFVGRDLLRSIKSLFNFEIYRQKDNNKLFIENDRKITLIDFRYINEELIEQYIKFENQDILFLYSVPVLNSRILK